MTRKGPKDVYIAWKNMKQRCVNPNHKFYDYYGGRGIAVCARWFHNFEIFKSDMGDKPVGTSIDRINNDGNYEPGNCRWANKSEQSKNQRPRSPKQTGNGRERFDESQVRAIRSDVRKLKEIAQEYGIAECTVSSIKTFHKYKWVV